MSPHGRAPLALIIRSLLSVGVASVLALTVASCAVGGPTPTSTTPTTTASSAPVVVEELGEGAQDSTLDVDIPGPVQVNVRRITIKPGAGTGKHCHDGNLIAVVEKGTLTHYAPVYPNGVHSYTVGDSIVEGSGYVHEGKNEGTSDVVLLVTYVTPQGDQLAETDLSKCDPVG